KTLPEIWKDNEQIITPSWVGRAPHQAGSAGAGTLKADEWRNFVTITLVFSLIKQWRTKTARYQAILRNLMHLVAAGELANLRQINAATIAAYDFHIREYLTGHQELFLDKVFSIYQHGATHFADFLRAFGPVHSWRAYAFERYNGMMHDINTNSKIGEYSRLDPPSQQLTESWFQRSLRGPMSGISACKVI
ncbi:hypothetical protein SISNIDRAFT_412149, partial [Sistotremastrum niveocremeum HHB9708]